MLSYSHYPFLRFYLTPRRSSPSPHDLSDEAAANMLAFLYELTHRLERHYADQLYRYHNRPDARQADLCYMVDFKESLDAIVEITL